LASFGNFAANLGSYNGFVFAITALPSRNAHNGFVFAISFPPLSRVFARERSVGAIVAPSLCDHRDARVRVLRAPRASGENRISMFGLVVKSRATQFIPDAYPDLS
jgi:hypothetical protein